MKPRRTTVNRRKTGRLASRQHLLEVNVRTASIRRQRRHRTGGLLWKLSAAVVVLALLGAIGRLAAEKFLFRNPEYALRHLDVTLDGVMTREELVNLSGLSEGKNIFRLDIDLASRRLAALPEVRAVTVERVLPDTVKVRIERRLPVFLLADKSDPGEESFVPGKSFLCDREGVMIRPERLDAEFLKLPVLSGIPLQEAVPGKRFENDRLSFALTLQQALAEIPEESFHIKSIDVSKPYSAVVTDGSGARFTFGPNDFPGQLERLQKLLRHCQDTGRRLETANLMVSRNTPVTFAMTPESGSPRITPAPESKKSARR